MTSPASTLVFGVGNPSRGDDALGPMVVERLVTALSAEVEMGQVELLTDFQLQIEHALDLRGRTRVIFVDATVNRSAPLSFTRAWPRRDLSISTHSMSPEAVLETYRSTFGEPPETWVLAICGERFELGEPLSPKARDRLEAAIGLLLAELRGEPLGRRFTVEGVVQGVGFRPWVLRTAVELGLGGRVWNTGSGVTIEAFGYRVALEALEARMHSAPPPAARLGSVGWVSIPVEPSTAFEIARSRPVDGETRMALPPDLATCDACLRDVVDERDRHVRYAFTSCADCGPRFSIAHVLPFDRATTSMRDFEPCAACSAEYDRPDDRRFHAQTIACPACGPRAWLADPRGKRIGTDDSLVEAGKRLISGQIVGVQGLGAFHLVCDATSPTAVALLRRRKRRDLQPFAVMVKDESAADALALLDDAARAALRGPARPIVLAPSRGIGLAAEVNGQSRRAGVMLPYSALHHRLAWLVDRPLVVTSGNPSGGPAIIDADEAIAVLGPIVDAFLLHDRTIVRRVEDSVVTGTRVLRRSRGLSPFEVRLPFAAPEPVLAVGAHMKATACVVVDNRAYLSSHLGDLGTLEAERAFARDVEGFERLLGVHARVLAHDLHPEYGSTRYAMARNAVRRIGVQHHVAHVLAAMAEHFAEGPALGVVFDGTGFGLDGAAWGAEFLLVNGHQWSREATFRPLLLAGGERAIREPWRVAFAALIDAFGEAEALALAPRLRALAEQPESSLRTLARMIATGTFVTRAHGMGRWFDAIGALVLGISDASFDGHVAMLLEEVADGGGPSYPVGLGKEIDLRPLVRGVVEDIISWVPAGRISARFHRTIVEVTATTASAAASANGVDRVVLTGGCFQNRVLEAGLAEALAPLRVLVAREVPPNDGGIALGQAWAAVLALAQEPSSL